MTDVMDDRSWIEQHPNATQLERVVALAHSLPGTAPQPTATALEWYGLPEEWDISELEDGVCEECRKAKGEEDEE